MVLRQFPLLHCINKIPLLVVAFTEHVSYGTSCRGLLRGSKLFTLFAQKLTLENTVSFYAAHYDNASIYASMS